MKNIEQNLSIINDLLPVLTSGKTGVWTYNATSEQLEFKNDFFNLLGISKLQVEFSSILEFEALLQPEELQAFKNAFAAASNGENSSTKYCLTNNTNVLHFETTFMPYSEGVIACTVNKTPTSQDWEKQYRTLVLTSSMRHPKAPSRSPSHTTY